MERAGGEEAEASGGAARWRLRDSIRVRAARRCVIRVAGRRYTSRRGAIRLAAARRVVKAVKDVVVTLSRQYACCRATNVASRRALLGACVCGACGACVRKECVVCAVCGVQAGVRRAVRGGSVRACAVCAARLSKGTVARVMPVRCWLQTPGGLRNEASAAGAGSWLTPDCRWGRQLAASPSTRWISPRFIWQEVPGLPDRSRRSAPSAMVLTGPSPSMPTGRGAALPRPQLPAQQRDQPHWHIVADADADHPVLPAAPSSRWSAWVVQESWR